MLEQFNGRRLGVLRRIHGLTQQEFGERIDLHQTQLSRIERGGSLGIEIAHRASSAFGEPLTFFKVPEFTVPLGPTAFRRRAAANAAEKARVNELYREASRVFAKVSEDSGYREAELPDPEQDLTRIVDSVREQHGLTPHDPVRNLTRMFERLGVGVINNLDDLHEDPDDSNISGITMPTRRNTRPIVATTSLGRGDVQRMTLAHELGHLVFDRDAPTISCSTRSPQEQRAFALGSALLLPEGVIRKRINEKSTLRDYLALKTDYGLSAAAIMLRAHRLGLISSDRYRVLSIQHSSRGWRRDEPVEVPTEDPLLLAQAIKKVYPKSTYARASHELGLAPARLRRWAASDEADEPPATVTPLRRG